MGELEMAEEGEKGEEAGEGDAGPAVVRAAEPKGGGEGETGKREVAVAISDGGDALEAEGDETEYGGESCEGDPPRKADCPHAEKN